MTKAHRNTDQHAEGRPEGPIGAVLSLDAIRRFRRQQAAQRAYNASVRTAASPAAQPALTIEGIRRARRRLGLGR